MENAQIQALLYNLILTLISTGLPIVLGYITMYIKSHYTAKQIESAKEVAKISVSYVEQIAQANGINGIDKFNKALESVKDLGNQKGLKFSDSQWQTLIEGSIKESVKGWDNLSKVSNSIVSVENTEAKQIESIENNIAETSTNTLSVPETMMQETYNQIKAKATNDAELAVKSVLENVNKSILEEK